MALTQPACFSVCCCWANAAAPTRGAEAMALGPAWRSARTWLSTAAVYRYKEMIHDAGFF